jgi:hypothetical protein
MSLLNKNQSNIQNIVSPVKGDTITTNNDLESEELMYLLHLLKETTFKGQDVEKIYNLILKLQNQFIHKNKQ